MRRILCTLLLTAGILTGCGTAQVADKADLPSSTAPALQLAPDRTIQYHVELESIEQTVSAEDGQPLAEYHVQVPVMQVWLEDGTQLTEAVTKEEQWALDAAELFNDRFAIWREENSVQELVSNAQADFAYKKENGLLPMLSHTMDLSCTVYRTGDLVSVAGLCCSYTGGAHPNTWELGWNFDLGSGNFFGGEAISDDPTGFRENVTDELLRQAVSAAKQEGVKPEELYWPEYESILRNWGNYTVYFDSNGMHVVFSPYELAPYAAGTREFRFSYDWLSCHLSEQSCKVLGLECHAAEEP